MQSLFVNSQRQGEKKGRGGKEKGRRHEEISYREFKRDKKQKEAEECEPTLKRIGKSSQALALVEEGVKIRRESAQTE